MATLTRRPGRTYLLPTLGLFVISAGWWVLETWASNSTFAQSVSTRFVLTLIAVLFAFLLGLLAEDVANPDSWLRRYWADGQRLFVVESVVPAMRTDPAREYLAVTLTLRATRDVRDAQFVIRIREGLNLKHMDRSFVLEHGRLQLVNQQTEKRILAIVPLRRNDGLPLGYQTWGDTYRESGDTTARSFFPGTDNLVEIEMRAGWRTQREHVFIASLHHDSHALGRLFIATPSHPGLRIASG